jgi:hypothetical protein
MLNHQTVNIRSLCLSESPQFHYDPMFLKIDSQEHAKRLAKRQFGQSGLPKHVLKPRLLGTYKFKRHLNKSL